MIRKTVLLKIMFRRHSKSKENSYRRDDVSSSLYPIELQYHSIFRSELWRLPGTLLEMFLFIRNTNLSWSGSGQYGVQNIVVFQR